jgi:hypothetical protein
VQEIKVDKTPPLVTVSSPTEGQVFILNEAAQFAFACDDGLSGVASCLGSLPSGGALDTATLGPKTVTVDAADLAGNTASVIRHYSVISVSEALEALIVEVADLNLVKGIENSLDSKLEQAQKALEAANAGQRQDAAKKLLAFINEVEAQRGKALSMEQADQLVAAAERILVMLAG